jgi:glycosyltransferase involved in cell wall biosynthesis
MNIFLTLKCGHNDSTFFIQQFLQIKNIDSVFVFRDTKASPLLKVKYITSLSPKLRLLNFILRFWQIVLRMQLNPSVIVGIYEIPHGLIAVIIGKLFNKPTVVSVIGNPAYSKLRKGFRMKLTLWILKNASFITVTGNTSKRFLISKGISGEKVFVLPNTIDFSKFFPFPDAKKEYDIISLGRLSEEKKLDQIVRVIGELKKSNPHIQAAIGGTGPEKESIIRLVKDLELEGNIEVLGFIPDEELPAFLSKGRVFLLTSETEGFPRTIIQAAACGAAIVATNVGDVADVIEHGINGFLVDSYQDIEAFLRYTQILLTDKIKADGFVYNLDKKVRIQFANEQATIVWNKILNEINFNN